MDDSSVSVTSLKNVLNQQAYVLFYLRMNPTSLPSSSSSPSKSMVLSSNIETQKINGLCSEESSVKVHVNMSGNSHPSSTSSSALNHANDPPNTMIGPSNVEDAKEKIDTLNKPIFTNDESVSSANVNQSDKNSSPIGHNLSPRKLKRAFPPRRIGAYR